MQQTKSRVNVESVNCENAHAANLILSGMVYDGSRHEIDAFVCFHGFEIIGRADKELSLVVAPASLCSLVHCVQCEQS